MDSTPRSRSARIAAEAALVRVVHHYGSTPEFVVLGGLVPELLCAGPSARQRPANIFDVSVTDFYRKVLGKHAFRRTPPRFERIDLRREASDTAPRVLTGSLSPLT